MRANLWLRSASRVIVRVATFRATEFYELEKRAKRIDWERYLGTGATPEFRVTARKSKLYHSDAIAQRLAAACSRPSAAVSPRPAKSRAPKPESRALQESRAPNVERRAPTAGDQLFIVRVVNNEFTISADTSGDLLHMRGYRHEAGKAPLRENLAAALVLSLDWSGETPLVDPFCGSGTIPIEAALIARRVPPGRHRHFAFMTWPESEKKGWHQLLSAADAVSRDLPVEISGSDRDAGVIEAAQANAARAGVPEVRFSVAPVSAVEAPPGIGVIATNPPYGKRVSEGRDLRNLYAQFGHTLRSRFGEWTVAMFSPEPRLDKQLGLAMRAEFRTETGGIPIAAMVGKVAD